jgi:integrase/recombinase XerD
MMSNAGHPLRVIQEVSGHRTLDELQKYLEVRPEQVKGAIASLSMLSHVGKSSYDSPETPSRCTSLEEPAWYRDGETV